MIQRAEERMRAGKTAQCANALATKPDDPSSIPGSCLYNGGKREVTESFTLTSTDVWCHTHVHSACSLVHRHTK